MHCRHICLTRGREEGGADGGRGTVAQRLTEAGGNVVRPQEKEQQFKFTRGSSHEGRDKTYDMGEQDPLEIEFRRRTIEKK